MMSKAGELTRDRSADANLRPASFDEYIGQRQTVENLAVMIAASQQRGDVLEHLLLAGAPGLGKTSLAGLVSGATGGRMVTVSGPSLRQPGDLVGVLAALQRGDVFFIDEIHRLPMPVEEALYTALEDFRLDVVTGKGENAETLTVPLERFTCVGATTRAGNLSKPLYDRFPAKFKLAFYEPDELAIIAQQGAGKLGVEIAEATADLLASYSRGTPRLCLNLLRRVRDLAQLKGEASATAATAGEMLTKLGFTEGGLEETDRAILNLIADTFKGGPVGIKTLAAVLFEHVDTVADLHEPWLVRLGYMLRTTRGRWLTDAGYEYVGKTPPRGREYK